MIKVHYLVLLSVLRRGGLPADAGVLGGSRVLPPDRATRLVSDTLNLGVEAGPSQAQQEEHGERPVVIELKSLALNQPAK